MRVTKLGFITIATLTAAAVFLAWGAYALPDNIRVAERERQWHCDPYCWQEHLKQEGPAGKQKAAYRREVLDRFERRCRARAAAAKPGWNEYGKDYLIVVIDDETAEAILGEGRFK